MSFTALKFTTKGLALKAKAEGGDALNFTRLVMGKGTLSGAIPALTDVVDPVKSIAITGIRVGSNYATIKGSFTNTSDTDDFTGDGSTTVFTLTAKPASIAGVTVAGAATSAYTYSSATGKVTFTAAPASGTAIVCTYDLAGFLWKEIGVYATDPDEGEILYAYQNAGALAENIAGAGSELVEKTVAVACIVGDATTVTATIDSNAAMPADEGQTRTDLLSAGAALVDADSLPYYDSGASASKQITWALIKSTLKTYFDALYAGATATAQALTTHNTAADAHNDRFSAKADKTSGLTAGTTPADVDYIQFYDVSETADRKGKWLDVKAALKLYFNNIYAALSHAHSAADITSGKVALARGGTNASDAAGARTNLGAIARTTGTGTLTVDGWVGTEAPFTQSIAAQGITAAHEPHVDCVTGTDLTAGEAISEAWTIAACSGINPQTGDGVITFYAAEVPEVAIPVRWELMI